MPKFDFRLEQTSTVRDNEQAISISVVPPLPQGCKVARLFVNDKGVDKVGQTIGDVTVTNYSPGAGYFALKAPRNHPPIKVEVSVVCVGEKPVLLRTDIGGPRPSETSLSPFDFIKRIVEGIVNVFRKAADFLGEGITNLLPEDLRKALKDIKGLIGKGVDVVTNLLNGVKGLPVPFPPFVIPLPDNLEHLKKKIGEHLRDLDPLDDSPEAAIADAKTLRALIIEDVIPFVRQVGDVADKELRLYTQRLLVMQKMVDRLGQQLELIKRPAKGPRRSKPPARSRKSVR
jgi:hypothetical protein